MTTPSSPRTVIQRIASGLRASLPHALGWGLFATVVYLLDGETHPEGRESLPSLLTLYFSVAVVCGAVYGLLKDWAMTTARFGVMCSAIGVFWSAALVLMINDWHVTQVTLPELVLFGLFGVVLGPPIGFYLRSR